jgi:hypothetical protein
MGYKYETITFAKDIRRTHKKRKYLNTLENYHISNLTKMTYK